MGPNTRKPLPMIDARGVIVARQTVELATRGQINTAPNKTTTDRMRALSICEQDQIVVNVTTWSFFGKQSFMRGAASGKIALIADLRCGLDGRLLGSGPISEPVLAYMPNYELTQKT